MQNIYTPTQARQHLYELIRAANDNRKPVVISPTKKGEKGTVMIGQDDWEAIQETLFLVNAGVDRQIKARENDLDDDFDLTWDSLQ